MYYTLEEQLGQMICVGFRGDSTDSARAVFRSIRDCLIGGIHLTDNVTPEAGDVGNVTSPAQLRQLNMDLQRASAIPLFITLDGEGGEVVRLRPRYGFPSTRSARDFGERDDLDATRQQAARMAELFVELGVNFNFAPVVDLLKNPDMRSLGRKRRCYSADPEVVCRHAAAVIEEHHRRGIACAIKHFPGHGSAGDDSHLGMVDVTATWSPEELEPFRRLISRGVADGVMTAHVFLRHYDPDSPATLSRLVLDGLLRNELGFSGVILTDDLGMGALKNNYSDEDVVAEAVDAGADILLHANVHPYDEYIAEKTFETLRMLVKNGRLCPERIAQSFARIMALKRRLGLVP
jgi:beta-N-acetylhexosaminidase